MKNFLGWFGLNYLLSVGLIAIFFVGVFVAPLQIIKILPWLIGAIAIAGANFLVALAVEDESCSRFQRAVNSFFR